MTPNVLREAKRRNMTCGFVLGWLAGTLVWVMLPSLINVWIR